MELTADILLLVAEQKEGITPIGDNNLTEKEAIV